MEKTYNPQAIEQPWYQTWEKNGYFAPSGHGEPYTMMLPPPNVTGSLHMGHGFGFTLMDVLIRYHRMMGRNTLWQPGTDHASISTQMVVEQRLLREGKSRHDIGRDAFLEKVWAWKEESGGEITRQLRRLGASLDWQRERFTMDEDYSYAVREAFIRLFNEGLIYRGKRLVNWDPVLLTAVSDLEVVNQEEEGKLWHIRYPLVDRSGMIVVATTRPETLLGDIAVAVHPDDERYQAWIGKELHLPLTDRVIPIIADDSVDPLFGSGCVKITPAHDFNDFALGTRHGFTPLNIFTPDAKINENAPLPYRGLDRFKARQKILADLEALQLIEKIDKHNLNIPRGEKSGAVIEPYLTFQWFLKTEPLAKPAIRTVEEGKIRFIPENWDKTYYQWMNHIEDWCISRQLWWGHRIPVWYDNQQRVYVGHDEANVRICYQLAENILLEQEHDVLDTWFSAGIWPFTTLGWPQQTPALKTFFPTSVLATGFDIIFFWVARMIMMSLKFTEQIPFQDIYITGLIRDTEGHKMSKSKGNVLDPIDLIDGITLEDLIRKRTYGLMQPAMAQKIEKATRHQFPTGITSSGTDALRFTFCSIASYTRDIRFDMSRLEGNRNFCNKLWNASRYVLMNIEGHTLAEKECSKHLSLPDRWILSRLQKTITEAHVHYETYRFDLLAQTLYDFTWNTFCDWYLELSKPILTGQYSAEIQQRTRYTLVSVLEQILRLLHPLMPFITEEIWQKIAPLLGIHRPSIMLESYPLANNQFVNEEAEKALSWIQNIITAIRILRSEKNISPGKPLSVLIRQGSEIDKQFLTEHHSFICALAKLESIEWISTTESPPESASVCVGELEIFILLTGLINKAEENTRLQKEMAKLEKDRDVIHNKLKNPQFVEKAPVEVVAKEKSRLEEIEMMLIKVKNQLANL